MKVELKDVLHLYLGCQVQIKDEIGKLVSAGQETIVELMNNDEESGFYGEYESYPFDENEIPFIRPILRPLCSMSDQEAKEVALINYMIKNTILTASVTEYVINITTKGFSPILEIDLRRTNPQTFLYLLSKGFDLFGLIGSGQAIDSTIKEK